MSAARVSLGFVSSTAGGFGRTFFAFGAVALGATVVVCIVSFSRCTQNSIEDLRLLARTERVRAVYLELAPGLSGKLDPVLGSDAAALRHGHEMRAGRWTQLLLTMAGFVGVLNSAVLGVVAGFLVHLTIGHAGASWAVATVVAIAALMTHLAVQMRSMTAALVSSSWSSQKSPRSASGIGVLPSPLKCAADAS